MHLTVSSDVGLGQAKQMLRPRLPVAECGTSLPILGPDGGGVLFEDEAKLLNDRNATARLGLDGQVANLRAGNDVVRGWLSKQRL